MVEGRSEMNQKDMQVLINLLFHKVIFERHCFRVGT